MSDQFEQPNTAAQTEAEAEGLDILEHLKRYFAIYIGAVVLFLALVGGSWLMRENARAEAEAAATRLTLALEESDHAARAEALGAFAAEDTELSPEALYLKAETAYRVPDYDAAATAFSEVLEKYPEFQFAPDSLEGLGNIEENRGNFEAAIVHYLDVQVKYPDSYAARRQHYNLGRAYSEQGEHQKAIGSYRRQMGEFAESIVADRAKHKLDEYRQTHPDIYREFEQQFQAQGEAGEGITLNVVPKGATESMTVEEAIELTEREQAEREEMLRKMREDGTAETEEQ